jgi:transcriptional regulator with XRE-family HTH domain
MQGEQLKAIRKGLGWTIAQMAEALGMSETYVGQMERGVKGIERRTALAAYYLQSTGGRAPE